jgi:hypothetical protein
VLLLLDHSFAECHSQAGGEEQVVILQSFKRLAHIAVTESDLPAEPVFDFGGGCGIELQTIVAGVRDIGKNTKLLR